MNDQSTSNHYRIARIEKKLARISILEQKLLANEGSIETMITNLELISESVLGLKARLDKLSRLEQIMLDLESRINLLEKNLDLAFETINTHEGS